MAVFDESKVINALHPEKAEVGKKYWVSNGLYILKEYVVTGNKSSVYRLDRVTNTSHPFQTIYVEWQFLYPYEEPPKQRMTYRMLAEWLARGNGEYSDSSKSYCIPTCTASYPEERRDEPVRQECVIRSWDSEEWIEPTVDIYERDCKGDK